MESISTICCKLNPTAEQAAEIAATLDAFARACNHIADVARQSKTTNRFKLHTICYREVRNTFGLSANLTTRAIARTCTALKVRAKTHSTFEPTSADYDAVIFSFREKDWTFSLTMLHGRERFEACLGKFQKSALKGKKPTSATLVKHRDGSYYLHIQVKDQVPEPVVTQKVLGVDLGIVNLATDSDGTAYSGKAVEIIRIKHNLQRKHLQKRNTKGAKKKLKRVSGKENRFRRHENHVISRRIVDTAKRTGRGIALEILKGIRDRIRARSGDAQNRLSG